MTDLNHEDTMAALDALGLGVVSARGAINLADTSDQVFLGNGQYLRKQGPGRYEITGTAGVTLNFPGFPPIRGVGPVITEQRDDECKLCAPFPCDDPDRHLGVPSEYTPLRNRGCTCGADFDGRDCMCFEGY